MSGLAVLSFLVAETQPVPMVESYMPKAKTGNLKDPAKIKDKEEEHRTRWLEGVATHPLLALPMKVVVRAGMIDEDGAHRLTSAKHIPVMKSATELDPEFLETFQAFGGIGVLVGPHPLTHARMLTNACIRTGKKVPAAFAITIPRFNPWNETCPPSEIEDIPYASRAKLLGLPENDILEASVVLAARLGVFDMVRKDLF